MRCESAAMAKGRRSGAVNSCPREGTRLRILYDQFMANKAKPITVPSRNDTSPYIEKLVNIYGLDIRRLPRSPYGSGVRQFMLVGEWFGKTYVDYVADRVAKEKL